MSFYFFLPTGDCFTIVFFVPGDFPLHPLPGPLSFPPVLYLVTGHSDAIYELVTEPLGRVQRWMKWLMNDGNGIVIICYNGTNVSSDL